MTDRLSDGDTSELDDWKDLVASTGWSRLQQAFEAQWGDTSVVKTLESVALMPTKDIAAEARQLLAVRVALRLFLAHPATRISDLERQRAREAGAATKPWTRPA